ncbi:hypothetical protein [Streptomyces fungicidicus]|uniref:hypothetical protein n=1 Tax=Streptomyces fungicidicus TaxID=68203 RepID=UPI003D73E8C1
MERNMQRLSPAWLIHTEKIPPECVVDDMGAGQQSCRGQQRGGTRSLSTVIAQERGSRVGMLAATEPAHIHP